MLQSKHSEAFLAVAETGSFEQAAMRLNITASAVTLRLQTLEKQLGQVLIIRERPCKVTTAGQEVLLFLQHQRLMEQNLMQNLQGQSPNSPFFKLNIASNADSLATWLLPTIQKTLLLEKIVIDLKIDDQTQTHHLLEAGLVNACISTEAIAMKGCDATHLGKMSYCMVATPLFVESFLKYGVKRETLRTVPAVIFNDKDRLHTETMERLFGLMPNSYPYHSIPSATSFVDAILRHLGYGMVPVMQIQHELETGQLIEIMSDARTDLHLYWHHWKQQSKQLEQLTQLFVDQTQAILN